MLSISNEYNTADDEPLVTCENCGHEWDGYAQCSCYGIPIDEYSDDECSDNECSSERSHAMTLRSHTKKAEAEATKTAEATMTAEAKATMTAEAEATMTADVVKQVVHPKC